jgi:hypothetical protein
MLRTRNSARYFLIGALCMVAAAACGSAAAPVAGGANSGGTAAHASPKISLDVTVNTGPGTRARHWTLTCDPAGGTRPDPAAACRVLLAAKGNPFSTPPKHIMCPMIQIGTKKATVTGTWFGKNVNLTLADGGCTLGRWTQIGQIFN